MQIPIIGVMQYQQKALFACKETIDALKCASDDLIGHQGISAERMRSKIEETRQCYLTLQRQLNNLDNLSSADGSGGGGSGGGFSGGGNGGGGGF